MIKTRLANKRLIRRLLQIGNPKIRIEEAIEITDSMNKEQESDEISRESNRPYRGINKLRIKEERKECQNINVKSVERSGMAGQPKKIQFARNVEED